MSSQSTEPSTVQPSVTDVDGKPSRWSTLAARIPEDFLYPDYANGPPRVTPSSMLTAVRLFDQKEEDVRVELYRDSAHWVGSTSQS